MEAPRPPATVPIRVAVVEDDPEFQAAVGRALRATPDMKLAGRAGTRAQGLALLEGEPADVLLVDLGLPDGSGIDVIEAASRLWPLCGIVVSTIFGDESNLMRSIESGAAGYLFKDSSPQKMVEEIRSTAAGGSPISPLIARQVLRRFQLAPASLSPRERELLDSITKGFTIDEIAKRMQLSRHTVLTFVHSIYGKLKVISKAVATAAP